MKTFLIVILSVSFILTAFGQKALRYHIEKIEYESSPGDWEGCSFNLRIDTDKTVEYIADSTYCKPLIGKHQAIDKEKYDSLIGMLNKIEFPKLKDRYGGGADMGINVLTITYNQRKIKKIIVIDDEPNALEDILHLLYGLKDTEHWR